MSLGSPERLCLRSVNSGSDRMCAKIPLSMLDLEHGCAGGSDVFSTKPAGWSARKAVLLVTQAATVAGKAMTPKTPKTAAPGLFLKLWRRSHRSG